MKKRIEVDSTNIVMLYLIVVICMVSLGSVVYIITKNDTKLKDKCEEKTTVVAKKEEENDELFGEVIKTEKTTVTANGKEVEIEINYLAEEVQNNKIKLMLVFKSNGTEVQKINAGVYLDKTNMFDTKDLLDKMSYTGAELINVIKRPTGEFITITDRTAVLEGLLITVYNDALQYVESYTE